MVYSRGGQMDNKLFHMKRIFFLFLIALSGCCGTRTTTLSVDTVFTERIDTVYQMVPYITEPVASKTIDINLSTLCDSLYKGQLQPQVRTSEAKRNDGTRQLIARTVIDSLLHLSISCNEDAYRDTLDSVRTMNKILQYDITNNRQTVIEEPFFRNEWFIFAMVELLIILFGTYFLIKK